MRARTMFAVAVVSLATLVTATATEAGHAQADRQIYKLAFEVEKSAQRAHRSAERHTYGFGYEERRALRSLQELDRRSREFRKTLERYGPFRGRTEEAFLRLNDAAWSARREVPGTRIFRRNQREIRRLAYLLMDLRQEYRLRVASLRREPRRHGATVRVDARTARGHATYNRVGQRSERYDADWRWEDERRDDERRDDRRRHH